MNVTRHLQLEKSADVIRRGIEPSIAGMRTAQQVADAYHTTRDVARSALHEARKRGEVTCGTDGVAATYWWAL